MATNRSYPFYTRLSAGLLLLSAVASAQLHITTTSVPTAGQYQSYNTPLAATGGTLPYTWSVVSSTGVSLPEGMSLNPTTGVVSAAQVNGQGGYGVTVQVSDSASPTPNVATATINFGVTSDPSYGGCQMFPPDSIYNQRIDLLPADTNSSHQIPSAYLTQPLHPDFGHGFYPSPGGIPFMRVAANQPATNVNLAVSGQIDANGTYSWPFPAWPNAVIEGTSYGPAGDDHHILILQSSVNNINGPQTGPCTLYETYQSNAVPSMFNTSSSTWLMLAGLHYVLNSNEIAASTGTLDNGAQDSPGIPMVPLLIRYSEVPLGVEHPLRITFPSPTNGWVWPATGCCAGSGPPQGLLYRLKASVNWQAVCPVTTNPQAATLLHALQQYGAYMSDHGSSGYIQGVPDIRWDDNDLGCFKNFHVSDLEVVDNSGLEVSSISGQTKPYVVPATLLGGTVGAAYNTTILAVGGNPATRQWLVSSGALPPGLLLGAATGTISGTITSSAGSPYNFAITATDTASGHASEAQPFSIAVTGTDTTPPSVSVTAPTANTTVLNTITVTATASDNVAVADVQFQLDGVNLGPDLTTPPYSISWNTTTASNGSHNLTAIARDTSHNAATSAAVPVTVSNTVTGPPTAGLIGYWNFDEGTGSIAHDTSGSGYNGAINGATWTAGKINSALNFSGSTDYVVTPNIAVGTTFSISAWVNSATTYQGYYTRITETHYAVGLFLGTNTNGARYKFIVNNGTGSTGSCGLEYGCAEGGLVTGGWHLVTGTFDGASAKLYVDGALVASDTFTAPSNTNRPLYIGQAYTGNSYGWNGGIDEVRLYNRALTVAEVSALYNNNGSPSDTIPPTVSITVPTANTTVSNTITVTATASDNVAVADVQFQLDGVNLGPDLTTPPYSISWNTTTASNGSHNLTAIARDTSHNAATSAAVPVTVSNTVTGPPTAGLIGYWNFDEGTGSIAHDTSGSGYNGAINGATWTAAGKINSALNFSGSTDYVVTPNIAVGTTFSISAWVNSASTYQGYYTRIAETHYAVGLFLGTNTNGARYKFIVNNGTGSTGSCGLEYGCAEGGLVTGGWHLVTGTFDGASAKLYVDGALVASDTFTAPSNTNRPLYIGQAYTGSSYGWNGGIDEVRLYNRALTVAEVSALYNNNGSPSDTIPPTVSITVPTANTTVSNTITVTATASDNVAVADVQFQLDGVNLGADLTTPPYSISWNTTTASNGSHNLTAIARDTSHNAATSAVIPVTVSNTVTGPPTAGLIGYWNFDEGTGSIAHDTSGSGYNGAINGATWTAGKINSALNFSGSTDYVVTPNIAVGTTFSISAWVNSATTYQGYYTRIAETHYAVGLFLGTNTNGARYKFIVNNGTGSTGSCGLEYGCAEGGLVTGGWHLVTGTFDGASAKLYVDGALVASDTFTAPSNTNRPLYIGQAYTGSSYGWNGGIDEVRLYNRALTVAEVGAIFGH